MKLSTLQDSSTNPLKKRKTALEQFKDKVKEYTSKGKTKIYHNITSPEAEIEKYLSENLSGDSINILEWWAKQDKIFPTLQVIAYDWLAVPASSVPCEQMFSIAGNIVTRQRNNLLPETTEALLYL